MRFMGLNAFGCGPGLRSCPFCACGAGLMAGQNGGVRVCEEVIGRSPRPLRPFFACAAFSCRRRLARRLRAGIRFFASQRGGSPGSMGASGLRLFRRLL